MTTEEINCKIIDTSRLTDIPSFYKLDRAKVAFAENLLTNYKPNVVVIANDHGINGTFMALCKLKRIPTLAIQDGILSNLNTVKPVDKILMANRALLWKALGLLFFNDLVLKVTLKMGWPARRVCWGTTPIDRIAVMGKYYKKVFVDRGVNAKRIVVTGYPLLDEVAFGTKKDQISIIEQIGLDSKKPVVLLITQPFVEDGVWTERFRDYFLKSVIDLLVSYGFQLIIKLHPRESVRSHSCPNGVYLTSEEPLEKLISICDVAATVNSTAGLLALAYGKPLIVLTSFPCGKSTNLLNEVGTVVEETSRIPKVVAELIDEQKRKNGLAECSNKLYDHIYQLDGKASERIARLIIEIVKN